jgi:sugar phosphate isomerase/epimerase
MKMLKDKLAHFYSWRSVADDDIRPTMARFAAAGHERLVVGDRWCERLLADPAFRSTLKDAFAESGCVAGGSHAPYWDKRNVQIDSFTGDPDSRFVKRHIALLELLPAEFGVKTYTLHIGWRPDGVTPEEYMEQVIRGLEILLPAAEKNNVTIALENAFSPASDAAALKKYVKHFDSPYLGVCVDAGHANISFRTSGKTVEAIRLDAIQRMNMEFVFCDKRMEEELLPYIVVAHLHDNDGFADEHNMPMTGNVDWTEILGILARAPRLASVEDEAGPRGMAPEAVAELYDRLFAQCARDTYMAKVS